HFAIAIDVVSPEVIEQTPALTDNLQQPAPGPMVFFMRFEVLGQVVNTFAKQSDLNFRGPGIGIMDSILIDDRSFVFLRETHYLRFKFLFYLQPSILLYSELIEVSTSRGCAQPLSTEATATNSPLLFKMRAKSTAHALRIWLPWTIRASSISETSMEGHEDRRRFIGIKSA